MGLYAMLAQAIDSYTGLSPASFFTIVALAIGAYRLVCGFFVEPDAVAERRTEAPVNKAAPVNETSLVTEPTPVTELAPLVVVPAAPVQVGDISLKDLRGYDGSDPKKPLLMAIKRQIYDVSMSRMFYGPGGPYALFAGRDASRALAQMSFDPNDLTGDLDGLSSDELEVLQDWEMKFMEKYVKVGQLLPEETSPGDDNQCYKKMEGIQQSHID